MALTILRDGLDVAAVADQNEAFSWLLRHQGQSVDYALRYGGYRVIHSDGSTCNMSGLGSATPWHKECGEGCTGITV